MGTRRTRRVALPLGVGVLVLGVLTLVGTSPAGATDVSNEADLRAAFDTDAQVDLLNDITLTDCDAGDLERTAPGPVTVDGHGFTLTQTCLDNHFETGVDFTLQNITLTGGREFDDGGAIDMNGGSLTVIDSTFIGNCANDSAGAIEAEDDDVTIISSTFTDNHANDQAGAIRSKRGNILMVNSTVTGNSQGFAGAVDSGSGADASLTLVYNTIVENEALADNQCIDAASPPPAGDIEAEEPATPTSAPSPANVNALDGFAAFGNVVALPIGAPNCTVLAPGSQGYNFSDDDSCGFTGTGDRENAGDPGLGALADNGGPTQTRLPLDGSPLIDWIPLTACSGGDALAGFAVVDDQRNVARPQGAGCEVGSVEIEVLVEEPPAEGPIAAAPAFTG